MHFVTHDLTHLLAVYGYWAVLLFVAIESIGIPFPGETICSPPSFTPAQRINSLSPS